MSDYKFKKNTFRLLPIQFKNCCDCGIMHEKGNCFQSEFLDNFSSYLAEIPDGNQAYYFLMNIIRIAIKEYMARIRNDKKISTRLHKSQLFDNVKNFSSVGK